MRRRFGFIVLTALFLFVQIVSAAEVTLQWTAVDDPDLAGYVVYYTDDQNIPEKWSDLIASGYTEYIVDMLDPGVTYYFTLTAFGSCFECESDHSNIVTVDIPAWVPAANPKTSMDTRIPESPVLSIGG